MAQNKQIVIYFCSEPNGHKFNSHVTLETEIELVTRWYPITLTNLAELLCKWASHYTKSKAACVFEDLLYWDAHPLTSSPC